MTDPKIVDIKVFLHPKENPQFHLECDELPKGTQSDHFVFNNDGHPGFLLNYILQEPTHGYFFPHDSDEALYSAKGEGCPTRKGQWGQFKAKAVSSNYKTLVVRNMNQKNHEGCFGYTLRVTKTPADDNATYLDLDPGGTNNNGNYASPTMGPVMAFVGGTAIGGVVALTAMPLTSTLSKVAVAVGAGVVALGIYMLARPRRALTA